MAGILEQIDAQLENLFKDWGLLTTIIAFLLLIFVIYPTVTAREADTHPFLLHRQANVSPVRQPGESAVYRSLNTLHGYPLLSGLNVKESGENKWANGKPGDLRDIWRRASGQAGEDGSPHTNIGKITTIIGVDEHVEHDYQELSRQINRLGQYVKQEGVTTVAIYLPNSIEMMIIIFAAAFYGFQPVLIPYHESEEAILQLLQLSKAEFLVASAGSLDFGGVKKQCHEIKGVMFVVPPTSRHMDFSEGSNGPTLWHDMIESQSVQVTSDLPNGIPTAQVPNVTFIRNSTRSEILSYSQKNIVSAIAAHLAALPTRHRITSSDTFLAADSFSSPYILIPTFAALFSNANIVIHSVAGPSVSIPLASRGVSPTIIAASSASARQLHTETLARVTGTAGKWALTAQMTAMEKGYMPGAAPTLLSRFSPPVKATLGQVAPGSKLRLLYIYECLDSDTDGKSRQLLSSEELAHLRAFTGARVIYALAAAKVAGVVAQTGFYDYRVLGDGKSRGSHFGPPVGSVEVKLVEKGDYKIKEGERPQGEIVVSGPAVVGGSANLGVVGTFREDGTLALL